MFIRLITATSMLVTLGACEFLNGFPQPKSTIIATDLREQAITDSYSSGTSDKFVEQLDDAQKIYEARFLDITNPDTPSKGNVSPRNLDNFAIDTYVGGRVTQVNDLCKIYFDGLVKRDQTAEFGKDALSLGSKLTSAVLGLTGAAAIQLAALAIGEAGISGAITAYEELYFLTADPALVYARVRTEQATELARASPNQDFEEFKGNYPKARNFVRTYAAYCTPERIRTLINKALVEANPGGLTEQGQAGVLRTLSGDYVVGGKTLTLDQGADLLLAHGNIDGISANQITAAKMRLSDAKVGLKFTGKPGDKLLTKFQTTVSTLKGLGFSATAALFAKADERKAL